MTYDLEKLLDFLQVEDPNMLILLDKIRKSLLDKDELKVVLDQQCKNRSQVNCYSCYSEGMCSILTGVTYFVVGQIKEAIVKFEDANHHFRSKDETWNSIIGLELLGMAYEKSGNRHQAILEYKQAHDILAHKYIPTHRNDYTNRGDALKEEIERLIQTPITPDTTEKTEQNAPTNSNTCFLVPISMPIYSTVQAHPDGPVLADPPLETNYSYINKIILEDKYHTIHSLTGKKSINLTGDKKYGWAKVSGISMSAAKPESITNNSFVLFYQSNDAADGSIVIASCPDVNRSGYEYVIKRYNKRDKLLLSETEPANLFDPIPIIKDVRILGTVIAVAKPV